MQATFTAEINPVDPLIFVRLLDEGKLRLYVGSLAIRVLRVIEYVAQNRHLIKDRPSEGLNKNSKARISEEELIKELASNGQGTDGCSSA